MTPRRPERLNADASGAATVTPGEQEGVPLLEVPVDVLGSLALGGASADPGGRPSWFDLPPHLASPAGTCGS